MSKMGRYAPVGSTLAACVLALHSHCASIACEASNCDQEAGAGDDVALLQTQVLQHSGRLASADELTSRSAEPICQEMGNHGAYFTVQVEVGTPKQAFDIVADTGSNALIVPDCRCKAHGGGCAALDICFATSQSKSFLFTEVKTNKVESPLIPLVTLGYGSGNIICGVASDEVTIGRAHIFMKDGIFLMENREELAIPGDFQGILGMGLPEADLGMKQSAFLQEAGISRYSLCFNAAGPGMLRMNVPPLTNAMTNIGKVHWGLELQGMSVGPIDAIPSSAPVLFCDPKKKSRFQQTACAAIPDSGTTLLMGQKEQIDTLYGALCTEWPRCNAVAENNTMVPRSKIFTEVLANCDDWLDEAAGGIQEVPAITIHLAGADRRPQKTVLTAWSWVVRYMEPDVKTLHTEIAGLGDFEVVVPSGEAKSRCAASFGAQDYVTREFGPVWILGSPLFYENTVSFDISDPPAVAINPGNCRACKASLLDTDMPPRSEGPLRSLHMLRKSSIDVRRRML